MTHSGYIGQAEAAALRGETALAKQLTNGRIH